MQTKGQRADVEVLKSILRSLEAFKEVSVSEGVIHTKLLLPFRGSK